MKYKSWHVQKQFRRDHQELTQDELLEFLFVQRSKIGKKNPKKNWEEALESGELIELVTRLSQRQQEVLWLLFIENLSGVQVKKRLNVSQQSISKTKKRALNNIKKKWEEKK